MEGWFETQARRLRQVEQLLKFKNLRKRLARWICPDLAACETRYSQLTQAHEAMKSHYKWIRGKFHELRDRRYEERVCAEAAKLMLIRVMRTRVAALMAVIDDGLKDSEASIETARRELLRKPGVHE